MPPLRTELIDLILACSFVMVVVSLLLIACAAWLRFSAARRSARLKLFRSLVTQAITAQTDARNGYQAALAGLRANFARRRCPELEQALLDCVRSTGAVDAGRRIADDLGVLDRWRQGVGAQPGMNGGGRVRFRFHRQPGFLTRARCASNIATVRDRASWKLLVQALNDSHPDVQRAALRAIAELNAPQSARVLAGLLAARSAPALGGAISERSLRAAWAHMPSAQRAQILPLLAQSAGSIRRLALEIYAQPSSPNGAAESRASRRTPGIEIPHSLLNEIAADPDAEVRARAADLLAISPDGRAEESLRTLLGDSAWFVRLHAVRAVAARRCPKGAEWVEGMLNDPHWRVRESAAHALSGWGSEGLDRLSATFQCTADVYARDQIAEALETSGHSALLNGVSVEEERANAAAAGIIPKTG